MADKESRLLLVLLQPPPEQDRIIGGVAIARIRDNDDDDGQGVVQLVPFLGAQS